MSEFQVRIVRLEPTRVASVHGFGTSPEDQAWEKLAAWAKPKGFDLKGHRIFGFNNPNPTPASPNYGYEFWMTVGPEVQPEGEVEIKDFPGGLYAVTRCEVKNAPGDTIPACWSQFVLWRENSPYQMGTHQWLEEHIGQDTSLDSNWDLDLYMPIAE